MGGEGFQVCDRSIHSKSMIEVRGAGIDHKSFGIYISKWKYYDFGKAERRKGVEDREYTVTASKDDLGIHIQCNQSVYGGVWGQWA